MAAPPLNTGVCRAHGKMLFRSRKVARLAGRRAHHGGRGHLTAYECEAVPGLWHYGHLPVAVVRGLLDRKWVSTRRIDLPE